MSIRRRPHTVTAVAVAVAAAAISAASPARADAPRELTAEARALFAVAACGEPPPAGYDAKVVAAHCGELAKTVASWRANWRDKAAPFFGELLRAGYPSSVVYPFGGGDLLAMLVVYPDATEYTSLSLEGIGDPRPVLELAGGGAPREIAARARRLAGELARLRKVFAMNLGWAWNTTIQLSIDSSETGAGLPGILAMALVALAANGYEPLEVRYWKPDSAGAVDHLGTDELAAWDAERARTSASASAARARRKQTHALQQGAFNNVEIVFRKLGDASAPRKTFRHIAADLSDAGLAADRAPLAHLERKGEVAAMTKAASYLLWNDEFKVIRDYLLGHMKLMISDDTGIPPRHAKPAGFRQDVWGAYSGTFFRWANQDVAKEMIELHRGTTRTLPFRFGYYDSRRRPHLMYTHK